MGFVFSSKQPAGAALGAQRQTLVRKPEAGAFEARSQAAQDNLRPQMGADNDIGDIGPTIPTGSASKQESPSVQSYAQWAHFTVSAPGGDSGPSFEDKASPIDHTWTPAGRG